MSASRLFDFAVTTIFAREFLEGSIIIGEYRTIILRSDDSLAPGIRKEDALKEIRQSTLVATLFAIVVIAAIAVPLAILSNSFDSTTSNIIEGVSKIVAAISLMQLSLKLPKWLGVYGSRKKKPRNEESAHGGLTLRSIRFNVAWNIWREVAECGVFLIPFFLSGENLQAIPLSAVIGSFVGIAMGLAIYIANKRLKNKIGLSIFAVLLLLFLSAGLFSGGCHKLEKELGKTKQVWQVHGNFWSIDRLPMTLLKPFGWNDSRTVLEIVCYWSWLALGALLHFRKYRLSPKVSANEESSDGDITATRQSSFYSNPEDIGLVELGEATPEESMSQSQLEYEEDSIPSS